MKNNVRRGLAAAVAAWAVAVVLGGCGGGGGGGGSGGSPGNGEAPPATASSLNPGLTGHLWFKLEDDARYFSANANTGVETLLFRRTSTNEFYQPSPDGSRYLSHAYDGDSERTLIRVYARGGTLLGSFWQPGWVTDYRFSPDAKYLGLLASDNLENSKYDPDNADAKRGVHVIDLSDPARPTVVRAFYGRSDFFVTAFDWLPDGKYVYLRRNRTLVTGSAKVIDGAESVSGVVAVPANFGLAGALEAHPDGSQLAVMFTWMDGPLPKSDVWVTNLQGTGAERITQSGLAIPESWSPDGAYLMVRHDTGSACVAGGCFTHCAMTYVPRAARNFTEAQATPLRVVERNSVEGLSCRRDVTWTQ